MPVEDRREWDLQHPGGSPRCSVPGAVMRALRSFLGNTRGAAAVEMALILPIVMTLLFGGMEGGYYFWSEHRVVKAVRDGARYAGRQSFDQFDCATGEVKEPANQHIKDITRTGTWDGSGDPIIPGWNDTTTTIILTVPACDPTYTAIGLFNYPNSPGAIRVRVSADVPYRSLFAVLGFDTSTLRLRASEQAVVMGL